MAGQPISAPRGSRDDFEIVEEELTWDTDELPTEWTDPWEETPSAVEDYAPPDVMDDEQGSPNTSATRATSLARAARRALLHGPLRRATRNVIALIAVVGLGAGALSAWTAPPRPDAGTAHQTRPSQASTAPTVVGERTRDRATRHSTRAHRARRVRSRTHHHTAMRAEHSQAARRAATPHRSAPDRAPAAGTSSAPAARAPAVPMRAPTARAMPHGHRQPISPASPADREFGIEPR